MPNLTTKRLALVRPMQILCLVSARDVWLQDTAGRRYLDAYNNVPHVGHCHLRVVESMCRQAGTLNTHSRYLSELVLDYHEQLLATFDRSLSCAMLTCTGSEANELALRISRRITGGVEVIVSRHTYRGNTAAVAEVSTAYRAQDETAVPHVRAVRAPIAWPPVKAPNAAPLVGTALAQHYLVDVREALADFEASHGACAVGPAVLQVVQDEALMSRATEVGQALMTRLCEMMPSRPGIGDVRGRGAFLAVEIVREDGSFATDAPRAGRIVEAMREAGVLIARIGPRDNVLKIRPPMTFDLSHASLFLHALRQSL